METQNDTLGDVYDGLTTQTIPVLNFGEFYVAMLKAHCPIITGWRNLPRNVRRDFTRYCIAEYQNAIEVWSEVTTQNVEEAEPEKRTLYRHKAA